ncbi:MAG TPA: hypothetical protein VKG25_21910 [Bryobacteraceae bacterium]|nr:hypothetical protein [Bryobacteraceae bacterium]
MFLLKMLSATVSVLGDATWRPLLLLVYVWTAYAGWHTFGLLGLITAMFLPGISQVVCLLYLWQSDAPLLVNYDWTVLCAVLAWLASLCGNELWNWIEARRIEVSLAVASQSAPSREFPLPNRAVQSGEVAS